MDELLYILGMTLFSLSLFKTHIYKSVWWNHELWRFGFTQRILPRSYGLIHSQARNVVSVFGKIADYISKITSNVLWNISRMFPCPWYILSLLHGKREVSKKITLFRSGRNQQTTTKLRSLDIIYYWSYWTFTFWTKIVTLLNQTCGEKSTVVT